MKIILSVLFFLVIVKINFAQNFNKDSSLSFNIPNGNDKFKLISSNKVILEGFFWDTTRYCISGLIIPLNDTIAESINFSYSGFVLSKTQLRLINGKYIEEGLQYIFDDNGNLSQVYRRRNGILNGEYISYFKNGTINIKGFFKDGNEVGIWLYFYKNGKFEKKVDYGN